MAVTADQVIALAQDTKALSKKQLEQILDLAPKMTEADLENLKKTILAVQEVEIRDMTRELEVYKRAASVQQEWQADQARAALQTEEGPLAQKDHAQAEALIKNI